MGKSPQGLTAEKIIVDWQPPTETDVDEVLESLGDVIAAHLNGQLDGIIRFQWLVDHFAANCDVAAAKAAIFRLIEQGLLRAAAVRSGQGKVALDQIELLPTAEFWRWDAEEEIQRLRTHWPTWDQQGIYKPQDSIDRLWNKLARVPGLIPPHCPRLPVVDFVDRLRGKAEEEIKGQWREFLNALSDAQRAIAGAVNGEPADATQQTTTGSGTTAGTAGPTGQGEGNAAAKPTGRKRGRKVSEEEVAEAERINALWEKHCRHCREHGLKPSYRRFFENGDGLDLDDLASIDRYTAEELRRIIGAHRKRLQRQSAETNSAK